MRKESAYPNIDLVKTGIHLKALIEQKGYTVRDIQRKLHLACPQPVYRWFKGQILPSVDHLYALSGLLCVHMEDLLIPGYSRIMNLQGERLSLPTKTPGRIYLLFYGLFHSIS